MEWSDTSKMCSCSVLINFICKAKAPEWRIVGARTCLYGVCLRLWVRSCLFTVPRCCLDCKSKAIHTIGTSENSLTKSQHFGACLGNMYFGCGTCLLLAPSASNNGCRQHFRHQDLGCPRTTPVSTSALLTAMDTILGMPCDWLCRVQKQLGDRG